LIDYKVCWDLQEDLNKANVGKKTHNFKHPEQQQETMDHLLFCEHPHVYTLGKSGDLSNLLLDEQGLEALGARFYKINRGGDITYHGPGQLVAYPILDLDYYFTDIHKYLRYIEEAVIRVLADYGIAAGRIEGLTGVWLDAQDPLKARKICAIGIRCSRWVTMHGLAFNVNTDLNYFKHIVPCGIDDKAVTSLAQELGREVPLDEIKSKLLLQLQAMFGFSV
jgi:lipoyl(octanoyl) transferase